MRIDHYHKQDGWIFSVDLDTGEFVVSPALLAFMKTSMGVEPEFVCQTLRELHAADYEHWINKTTNQRKEVREHERN